MTNKKILSHDELISKMLKNTAVKAELDSLNQGEFAILDEILSANKSDKRETANGADTINISKGDFEKLLTSLDAGFSPNSNLEQAMKKARLIVSK